MPRSVFVSYVFEDKWRYDQMKRWEADGLLPAGIILISEKRDVRQGGEPAVREHLQSRIQGASAVVVLVGNSTYNHDWVRYELSFATSANKHVLAVRLPDTYGAAPEHFRHLPLLPFDPSAISAALRSL